MKHIKECQRCKAEFKSHGNGRYCPLCRPMPRSKRDRAINRVKCGKCEICGKQLLKPGARYCTKHIPQPKGENHWNWRGGLHTSGSGYKQIYVGRINGKTCYKLEHHIVWETAHNMKLSEGYLVHHLNGIKDDNRPENLAAMHRSKHSVWTLVELAQQRIRDLEKRPELRTNKVSGVSPSGVEEK